MTDTNNIWTSFVKVWYKGNYIFLIICIILFILYRLSVIPRSDSLDIFVSTLTLSSWFFWIGVACGASMLFDKYKKEVMHAKKKD